MDAAEVAALVGYSDRSQLRSALAQVLAKSPHEKALFDECFQQFFRAAPWPGSSVSDSDEASTDDCPLSESGEGETGEGDASGEGGGESSSTDRDIKPLGNMDGQATASGEAASMPEEGGPDAGEEDNGVFNNGAVNLATAERLRQLQGAGIDTREGVLPALLRGDVVEAALMIDRAARQIGLDQIAFATQRGLYQYRLGQAMHIDSVSQAARILEQADDRSAARTLAQREQLMRQALADKVEDQLLLYSDAAGRALREDILKQANLSRIEQRSFDQMQVLVRQMAKKLEARHRRTNTCIWSKLRCSIRERFACLRIS